MSTTLAVDRLKELFVYDQSTGHFTRKLTTAPNALAGSTAGGPTRFGYWRISIDNTRYQAHRLVWLYMTGEWPHADIDHINGNRLDNRYINLRDVARTVNNQNRREAKVGTELGLLGITRNGSGYMAQIKVWKEYHYLGTFRTPELAHAAYLEAKRKLHEGCVI